MGVQYCMCISNNKQSYKDMKEQMELSLNGANIAFWEFNPEMNTTYISTQ